MASTKRNVRIETFTSKYMAELKNALKIESDYALAKHLQVSKTTVSNYSNGSTYFSPAVCHRVARILKVDPAVVISAIEVDRHSGSDQIEVDTWAWIHNVARQMQRAQAGFSDVPLLVVVALLSIAAASGPVWGALYSAAATLGQSVYYVNH